MRLVVDRIVTDCPWYESKTLAEFLTMTTNCVAIYTLIAIVALMFISIKVFHTVLKVDSITASFMSFVQTSDVCLLVANSEEYTG